MDFLCIAADGIFVLFLMKMEKSVAPPEIDFLNHEIDKYIINFVL
jgi:hypothetical protein